MSTAQCSPIPPLQHPAARRAEGQRVRRRERGRWRLFTARGVKRRCPHLTPQLGYLCCLFALLNASFRRRCGYLYPFGDVAAISTYSRPRNLGDISARWRQTRLARPPRRSGGADSPPRKEIERGRRKTWRRRRRTGSRLEKKSRVAEERNGRGRRGASSPA